MTEIKSQCLLAIRVLLFVLFLLVLPGCRSTSLPARVDSGVEDAFPQGTDVTPSAPVEDAGYLYLRLGEAGEGYDHAFIRVPAACVVDQIACEDIEAIPTYPESGIWDHHLHWSPDQTRALLLETNIPCIHIFDRQFDRFSVLLEDVYVTSDNLLWLSSDEALTIHQNNENSASMLSLSWADGEFRVTERATLEGTPRFIGQGTDGKVYLAQDINGYPGGDASLKLQTVETHILQMDPVDGEVTELWREEDWLSMRPLVVTSDGHWLGHGDWEIYLWNLQTGEQIFVGEGVHWLTPSPDGRWLAAVFTEEDLYNIRLLDLETMEWKSLLLLRSSPKLYWSPNTRYLVLARYDEPDLVPGPIIAIDPETEDIFTPVIDLQGHQWVDDVSWGW
jgi:WD40 repeat protein